MSLASSVRALEFCRLSAVNPFSKAGDWYKAGMKYLFHIFLPWDGKRSALFVSARLVALYPNSAGHFFNSGGKETIVSCVNSHSCKNSPLRHMTDSRKTSGNIIFIDFCMGFTNISRTVENYSYFLQQEKNVNTEIYRD